VSTKAAGNLVVLQGGGPTPVVNASLYGVIDEARPSFARVLGARFGIEGLLRDDLVELSAEPAEQVARLKHTPGAALGSTRYKASEADLSRIIATLKQHDVRALVLIGGNGSLRGAEVLAEAVTAHRIDCQVVGVPKTIDNDIAATDRCPGFASAAKYAAQAVRDVGMDVRTLPQPVSLFETMGRGAGWVAGATALAKLDPASAPHLIYLPEKPFDVDRFLGDIDRVVTAHGWAVAVMNEGLHTADGKPVYQNADASQTDALGRAMTGGVASYLADVVTRRLKIRCRWEKPGLCGRASMPHVSEQDRRDAELVGRTGVRAALAGRHGHMIALRPLGAAGDPVEVIPLSRAGGAERAVPREWLSDGDLAVGPDFINYVRPLVGELIDFPIPFAAKEKR
jgi:6-phosphofructokinase 1